MKEIIIGPNFVGKSSIAEYLRNKHPDLNVKELDELLTETHGGVWPQDTEEIGRLIPPLIQNILSLEDIIFLTSYIDPEQIKNARQKGFRIIQLYLNVEELKKRNIDRDPQREQYLLENLVYQQEIKNLGLVDIQIRADKSIAEISQQILAHPQILPV